jgi:predicted Zn-dependent protease
MRDRLRRYLKELRRPSRVLLALALAGVTGLTIYFSVAYFRAESHYRAALRALEHRDFGEAMTQLRLYLEIRGENPEVRLLLARTARRAGDYLEADQQLEDYLKLKGMIPEAVDLERLLLRAQRGDTQDVEDRLRFFIEHDHPDKDIILEALVKGYMANLRLGHALDFLKIWLQKVPDNTLALFWRGQVRDQLRNPREAMEDYRRVVELDPHDELARLCLASCLLDALQPSEALKHYQRLVQKDPRNPKKLFGLIQCQLALGKTAEADKLLQPLAEALPQDPMALFLRGKLELVARRPDRAEPWLRKAVARAPHDRLVVYEIGRCLQQVNKTKEAEKWFARLREIEAEQKKLKALSNRLLQNPANADLRCEMGQIYLRNDLPNDGLKWLNSALRENPRHRLTHITLAAYYNKIGRQDLAAPHQWMAAQSRRPATR